MEDVPCPFHSYVLVSREQIARNYRNIRSVVGPQVQVAGVVKADAYGHGAEWLMVSSVQEGVTLRRGGIHGPHILAMAGFLPYDADTLVQHELTPVIHSLEQLAQFEAIAQNAGRSLPYHLKIDSGMGRLGTRAAADEILAVVGRMRMARLEGLMTHFASAADFTKSQTGDQLRYFHAICDRLREVGVEVPYVHTSSTLAVGYGRKEGWHQIVRTGHALYGYVSPARGDAPPQLLEVKPALTWKAKLLAVKEIPKGAAVGYDGTFEAPRPMRIGIIGAGYADGMFHRLSNCGQVIADGRLTAILGTISMDLTAIDLCHTSALAPGDEVTLLGREGDARLDAAEIAQAAGTISYNVLCSISARVKRTYF